MEHSVKISIAFHETKQQIEHKKKREGKRAQIETNAQKIVKLSNIKF